VRSGSVPGADGALFTDELRKRCGLPPRLDEWVGRDGCAEQGHRAFSTWVGVHLVDVHLVAAATCRLVTTYAVTAPGGPQRAVGVTTRLAGDRRPG
jgi:hypothetical protein